MNTLTSTHTYVEAVSAYLDDLPESERRELLEDLEQHISEVAAEAEAEGRSLEEILGSPESYARELRTSAGLPPSEDRLATTLVQRILSSSAVRWARRALGTAPARSVREFLPQLRPAWWVGRGYLGVLVLNAGLYRLGRDAGGYNWDFILPIPRFGGSVVVGLAAIVAAVWVSVALGRRAAQDGGARMINWGANAATIVVLLAVVTNPVPYSRFLPVAGPPIEYVEYYTSEWLEHPDGHQISNICAYDSNLRPLDRVLLYDQDGRPISNTVPVEYFVEAQAAEPWTVDGVDGLQPGVAGADEVPQMHRDLTNAYPRSHGVDPRTGWVVPFECPALNHPGEDTAPVEGDDEDAPEAEPGTP